MRRAADGQPVRDGRRPDERPAGAFTLVELLIVISIIGLLVALVAAATGRIIHGQKVEYTRTIMRTTEAAIEQFAEEAPLKAVYDRPFKPGYDDVLDIRPSFGPFPPYHLDNAQAGGGAFVANTFEPTHMGTTVPKTLQQRVARDLSLSTDPSEADYARLALASNTDDIRALYLYLKVYSPGVLNQIPPDSIKPLVPGSPEYVNPAHQKSGPNPGPGATGSTWVDVLGIHDAWSVPLDYFVQAKLEWVMRASGDQSLSSGSGQWRITERIPALRSRGISLDESKELDASPAEKWIFSKELPVPLANLNDLKTGELPLRNPSANAGWVRVRAAGDDYPYSPNKVQTGGPVVPP